MTPESLTSMSTESPTLEPVIPRDGWHVIHLFYKVEPTQWELFSEEEKLEAKTRLTQLVQDIRSSGSQLLTFSMVTPKADIGFMLLTPDLHEANEYEKKISRSLGADVLTPTYYYLSMTELGEYVTTREIYGKTLVEEGVEEGSDEFNEKLDEFERRITKYNADKLYPNMPDWQVFCFYPMGKRRGEQDNWYDMEFEDRRKLMMGHAKVGRTYAGRVRQLITGSTGLDDMEWGVSLFAHNTQDIKDIVYEMRFDKVSSRYADFGEFYIGLQLPLNELFQRVGL